jgi:hypothetical protein
LRSVIKEIKNTEQAKITDLAGYLAKKLDSIQIKTKMKNMKKLSY